MMTASPFARLLTVLLLASCMTGIVHAQTAPFDMSPERQQGKETIPQLPPPSRVTPRPETSPQPPSPDAGLPASPSAGDDTAAPRKTPAAAGTDISRRYIIPSKDLSLTGEYSRSAWSAYLTAEQAKAGQSITITYENAIVVAPETSGLELYVNNSKVGQERIQAAQGIRSVHWNLPDGLLRPGSNDFDLVANQRHRTDCDIQSTYDLWTKIDNSGSFLQFSRHPEPTGSAIEAVRALGTDQEGRTHFDMLVPTIGPMETLSPLLHLSQGLAVMSNMPNPQFSFLRELPETDYGSGRLTIAVGTATELAAVLPAMPAGADAGPLSTIMARPDGLAPIVVITGPSWAAVGSAIAAFIAPLERPLDLRRESISTERWSRPNAPFMFGSEALTFAQLGIQTTEFSGRRFRTGFDIAVPSDFYAEAYGEAKILLDAAFDASVGSGSHIEIYVNGNVASTVPIVDEGGGILRQHPIRMTMRHFRPGLNRIEIEAVLLSGSDAACTPGSSTSSAVRFAIFDSSQFHMPRYARIGQTPNLAALSGTGFPYSRRDGRTAFFMDRVNEDTLSAAANLLGKTAQISGTVIPLEAVSATNAIGDRNAIYIGDAAQLPASILARMKLDPQLAANWRPVENSAVAEADTEAALDAWQERLQGSVLHQKIAAFNDWLQERLGFSNDMLRLLPGTETVFRPDSESDLMLAQGLTPNGQGIWTLLTAPDARELRLASTEISRQELWQQVRGRIFTYARSTDKIAIQEARQRSFLPPVEPSFWNYRLIVTNWLSSNLLSYAFLIILASCALGMTTSILLRYIGRR